MLFGGIGVALGRPGLTWGTLVRSWGVLGRSRDVFGLSCGTLRVSGDVPERSWGRLGSVLGQLGPPVERPRALPGSFLNRFVAIGRSPEISEKPLVFIGFLRFGGAPGTSWRHLGPMLAPSWAQQLPGSLQRQHVPGYIDKERC